MYLIQHYNLVIPQYRIAAMPLSQTIFQQDQRSIIRRRSKAANQQFGRRRNTLAKKADQLAAQYGAKVALVVWKNGRYYIYQSAEHSFWLPSEEEIVGMALPRRVASDCHPEPIVSFANKQGPG